MGIVILFIIFILIYLIVRPITQPPSPSDTREANSPAPLVYEEHGNYYDIRAEYPERTPLLESAGAPADRSAVSAMKNFIAAKTAEFTAQGNFDSLTPADITMLGFDQGRRQTLEVKSASYTATQTVSYVFTIYEDTFGAHGNTYFKTFVFDLSTGKQVSLENVFTPGAHYLDRLSTISRAGLPTVIGEFADVSFIEGGTRPEARNFENFFFDDPVLVILFPPYQVAPYAAGPQTLRIPLAELSDILASEYQ